MEVTLYITEVFKLKTLKTLTIKINLMDVLTRDCAIVQHGCLKRDFGFIKDFLRFFLCVI